MNTTLTYTDGHILLNAGNTTMHGRSAPAACQHSRGGIYPIQKAVLRLTPFYLTPPLKNQTGVHLRENLISPWLYVTGTAHTTQPSVERAGYRGRQWQAGAQTYFLTF